MTILLKILALGGLFSSKTFLSSSSKYAAVKSVLDDELSIKNDAIASPYNFDKL
jgi:hypothetical protein